jgi:hypothetical protein
MELSVQFNDTAEKEIVSLVKKMELLPIVEALRNDSSLSDDLRRSLSSMLEIIVDIFSSDLPAIEKDPEETLMIVSRDINLARLLRERGLFRLYQLANERVTVDPETGQQSDDGVHIPLFMLITNPMTSARFATQEEFIGWFCSEAHVARSMVFGRFSTIDRTMSLGYSLEDTFNLVMKKPYAIRETLNLVAEWEKGELVSINPDVAVQIARKISPDIADQIEILAEQVKKDDSRMHELSDAMKPVIADLLQEVADHDRAKDALEFVRYDVLGKPEIEYEWDDDLGALVITFIQKGIDDTGTEHIMDAVKIPFVPDIITLPEEVKGDLIRRLPVKNKYVS